MKRICLILIILLWLIPQAVRAADLVLLKNRADVLINAVTTLQGDYFAAHGKYFQGIITPEAICDGSTQVLINNTLKPHDQNESWADFSGVVFAGNVQVPFQIRIDVYEQSDGQWGWVLSVSFQEAGQGYVYCHHEGSASEVPVEVSAFDTWEIIDA